MTLAVPSALGLDGVAGLLAELEASEASASLRVIVLRGSSDGFCRGMDLSEIGEEPELTPAPQWQTATRDFARVLQQLDTTRAITIAVVEGPAMGGGVGLLGACDFVVATPSATFGLPELLLGLVPAVILPVLARRIGLHPAKRWAMTQATWKADEAKSAGLVDRVVPTERLDVEFDRLVRVLLRAHPRGVISLKRLVRDIADSSYEGALQKGQDLLGSLLARSDVRQDIIGFRDFGLLPGEGDS